MRYAEHQASQPKKEPAPKERKVELSKPGKVTSETLQGAKNRPFLGGNYNGGR